MAINITAMSDEILAGLLAEFGVAPDSAQQINRERAADAIATGVVTHLLDEGVGGGGGSAYKTLLWQWNQSNTSQFEASAFVDSTVSNPTSPTLTASDDADVVGGKVLELTATAGSGFQVVNWLVLASELQLTWPGIYEIEAEVVPNFPSYGGICFFGDATSDHYYSWNCLGINGSRARVDAGGVVDILGGATNNHILSGTAHARTRIRLEGDYPGSGSYQRPRFAVSGLGVSFSADLHRMLTEPNGQWQTSGTTAPASWEGKTLDRFGLSIIGQPTIGTLKLSALRVFQIATS